MAKSETPTQALENLLDFLFTYLGDVTSVLEYLEQYK